MNEDDARQAREFALSALARREHSRHELERKLHSRGIAQAAIDGALDGLSAQGLQDDYRFAEAYVRQRAERGYGPRRIEHELRQRGVDGGIVSDVMAAADEDWFERARRVHARKFGQVPQSAQQRVRQSRFMHYRGFDSEHIRFAMDNMTGNENG